MDAVGVGQFAFVVAIDDVFGVVEVLSFLVRFLYAAAAWGVVACCGESYHTAVGHVERALYEAFAEGTSSDDDAAVLILYGSGEYFGSRCAVFIDEDGHFTFLETAASSASELLVGYAAPLRIDDHVAL